MLEIKNLNVKKDDKNILNDINLTVKEGEKILIKGDSGSGKSTFLKSILFFENFSGNIFFNDSQVSKNNIKNYRDNFVYIGQKAPSFNGTVKDFIFIPFDFKRNETAESLKDKTSDLLIKLSFDESVFDKKFNQLSGGEQQRITILQSLLLNRKIYLLDEITSSLDKENINNVLKIIVNEDKKTVISVSHHIEWEIHSDNIYEMKNGKLIAQEK